MGRPPCCDKSNVKRGLWTAEEDAKILAYVSNHGIGNWTLVPKKAGLNRCGKSCRLRWTNYLRPDLKHESFTPQEEQVIINLHQLIGSRWSLIAKHLPGRTDNDVKNYWNTRLRKKLSKMGIDPITHKPISQVLSDYGNIHQLSNNNNNNNNNRIITTNSTTFNNTTTPNHSMVMMMQQQQQQPQPQPLTEQLAQVASPCSSSSSTANFSSPPQSSSSLNWCEFLLTDPPLFHEATSDIQPTTSPPTTNTMRVAVNQGVGAKGHCSSSCTINQVNTSSIHVDATSSSSTTSFVDAILDRDTEIRSQFPQFLDASFDC